MKRLVALLAVVILACDPPFTAPVFVAAVRVTPDSATLETSGTLQLSAVATDSLGHTLSGLRVVWSSSVDSVATVSSAGLVHCLRPGLASISAVIQGVTGSATLHIGIHVTAVHIDQPPVSMVPGGTVAFSAFALDTAQDTLFGRLMTWTTSDTATLIVSSAGVATARAVGRAFLIAGTASRRDSIAVTVGLVRFVRLTTGAWDHTCGLTADSLTYCWGSNGLGQVGLSTATGLAPAPVSVPTSPRFATIAAGAMFTCGGQASGAIYCWGSSAGGRLGAGFTETTRSTPVAVATPELLHGLTTGFAHACALSSETVFCWGRNPAAGGVVDINWVPYAVSPVASFTSVAAAETFTCAIAADSAAFCWGQNESGELGNGTIGPSTIVPTAVAESLSFAQVAGGSSHACGLTGAGTAYCWGLNDAGQLGTGDTATLRASPVAVAGGLRFTTIAAGGNRTCALTTAGTVYCWGDGVGNAPGPVYGPTTFTSLTVGDDNVCGIGTDLVAYCWGDNGAGQVGDGTFIPRPAPTRVLGQP